MRRGALILQKFIFALFLSLLLSFSATAECIEYFYDSKGILHISNLKSLSKKTNDRDLSRLETSSVKSHIIPTPISIQPRIEKDEFYSEREPLAPMPIISKDIILP